MKALLSITYDLSMTSNFPYWESDWDRERGALDRGTREYVKKLIRLASDQAVPLQFFVLGSSLEDPDVDYLQEAAGAGCAIGSHTYHHIDVKALAIPQLQPLYADQPWRTAGRSPLQIVSDEIRASADAIHHRLGHRSRGFRAPDGYVNGLQDAPAVRQLLIEQGYAFVSSQRCLELTLDQETTPEERREAVIASVRSQQPFSYDDGLLEIPAMGMSDEMAFRDLGLGLEEWLELVRTAVGVARREQLILSLAMRPSILAARDPHVQTLRLLLKEADAEGEDARLKIVTNDTIADLWDSGQLAG